MIRSLQNLFAAATSHKPATSASPRTSVSNKASVQADFQNLFRSVAKSTPAPVTSAPLATAPSVPAPKTAAGDPPRLGPMTADPNTHTASPPPKLPDPITSSPWLPNGFQGDTNLMNRAEHENTMNAWLQNYTKWSNDQKTQIYQQALYNWQLNSQRCQDLGIAPPPPPTPPALDPIAPKPAGFWFT